MISLKKFLNKQCWEEKWSKRHKKYYYVNREKGVSQWSIPQELLNLPPNWKGYMSKSRIDTVYYIHKDSSTAQWFYNIPSGEQEETSTSLPIGWEKRSTSCNNDYYVNTQTNKSYWYLPSIPIVPIVPSIPRVPIAPRGLEWTGQSCYLDSTLFALFAGDRGPNDFVTNMLTMDLDTIDPALMEIKCSDNASKDIERRKFVQKELKLISESITRVEGAPIVKKCTNLREALIKCKSGSIYKKHLQADSGEFIMYLTSLFNTDPVIKKHTIYGTHNTNDDFETLKANRELFETDIRYLNSSGFIDVEYEFLEQTPIILLSSLLTKDIDVETSNNFYPRIITVIDILKAPYLIFNLFRLGNETSKRTYTVTEPEIWCGNEVFYEPTISVGDNTLSCYAIVIHSGACHYVAVARYGKFWYYYDDNIKTSKSKYTIIQFNSLEEIVKESRNGRIFNPLTNGTQFYYK